MDVQNASLQRYDTPKGRSCSFLWPGQLQESVSTPSEPHASWSPVTGTVGTLCLAGAVVGYLTRPTTIPERLLLAAGSLLPIYPGLVTDALGFGLLGVSYLAQRSRRVVPTTEPVT